MRDLEINLYKLNISFFRNIIIEIIIRREFYYNKRDLATQNTLIRRLRSIIKDLNDNLDIIIDINNNLNTLIDIDNNLNIFININDNLKIRVINIRKSFLELEKKSRRED